MPASLLRLLTAEDVRCPAGELVDDCDVRCHVLSETIRGRVNPRGIENFCCGNYTTCDAWRQHRDAEREGRDRALREQLAREAHGR